MSVLLSLAMRASIATKIAGALGVITSLAMLGFGGYLAYSGHFNPTPLIMGFFMFVSAVKTLKNSTYSLLKNEANKRDELARHPVDVHILAAQETHTLAEVMSAFNARKYNVVNVLGEDMHVVRRLDEQEIIEKMVKKGSNSTL